MTSSDLKGCLSFIQQAERLKFVLRSGHASNGRPESTAEHTWRLCLLAMLFEPELARDFADLNFSRLLQICVVHDLGEAISGDIPAPMQVPGQDKSAQERADLLTLLTPLDDARRAHLLALWDEYNAAQTPEARLVKALDKLETVIQHNQGANPPDFDHAFNLQYGQKHMAVHPLLRALRDLVDADTQALAGQATG